MLAYRKLLMFQKWKIKRRRKFERICWLAHKRHEINLAVDQAVIDGVISLDQADLLDLRFGLKDGKKRSIVQIARERKAYSYGVLGAANDIDMQLWVAQGALKRAYIDVLEIDMDELECAALEKLGYEISDVEIAELENSRSIDQLRQISEVERQALRGDDLENSRNRSQLHYEVR